jgi:hypothetical protein
MIEEEKKEEQPGILSTVGEEEEVKVSEEEVMEKVEAYTDTLISDVSKKEFPEDVKKEAEEAVGKKSKFADKPFLWEFMFFNPDSQSHTSEYDKLFYKRKVGPVGVTTEKNLIPLQDKFLIDIGKDPKKIEENFDNITDIKTKNKAIKDAKWAPIKERIDSISYKIGEINKILTKE